MKKSRLLGALCAAVFSVLVLPAHAALIGVLPATPGGTDYQAYYDDQLNLTWTANANINGFMTWDAATDWAANLTIDGVGGWRLPSMDVNGDDVIINCTSDQAACKDNEYGHLFNYGAGTVFGSGITASSPGPFSNVQSNLYWSSTEYAPNPSFAWYFLFSDGFQNDSIKGSNFYGWAVQSGNVGTPITPALTCLGDSFEAPFSNIINLKNKVKKVIPVKMSLVDADSNIITESDISSPPVINVSYTPGSGADYGNNADLVPPGLADDGNAFRFEYPYWVINLATKQFTSAGTYEVTATAGDGSYTIDATSCSGTFIRLP